MTITEQAKQYMHEISNGGKTKAFHLFATDTCCGKGVGMKVMPKKDVSYVEVDGLSFKFEREILLQLHGMIIDVTEVAGNKTFDIMTK